MIATRRCEHQLCAVRRPLWRAYIAADFKHLALFAADNGHGPQMAFAKISDAVAPRRKDRSTAFTDARVASGAHVYDPDFLLCAAWITRRVRNFARLIFVATAHVSDCISGRRENNVRQLLPLVTVVTRQLPRGKAGGFGDPNSSFAFRVKGPQDLVAA